MENDNIIEETGVDAKTNKVQTADNTYSDTSVKLLDYNHEENMAEKHQKHDIELLNRKIGLLGRIFGYGESAAYNISSLILLILVLYIIIASIMSVEFERYVLYLISLIFGYMFGQKISNGQG